jgi:hypothetical protein
MGEHPLLCSHGIFGAGLSRRETNMAWKEKLLTLVPVVFASLGSPLRATPTITAAANSTPTQQVADSLPFAMLIGLLALGAVLVLRKMIRDLF